MKKILTMDWERLIPGHPGAGGRQIGNKDDVKMDLDYVLGKRPEGSRGTLWQLAIATRHSEWPNSQNSETSVAITSRHGRGYGETSVAIANRWFAIANRHAPEARVYKRRRREGRRAPPSPRRFVSRTQTQRHKPIGTLHHYDEDVRNVWRQTQEWRARSAGPPGAKKPLTEEQWTILVKVYYEHGGWGHPGPTPDCTGCEAPADILAQYGFGPKARRR
jgi:hypothetical protein